jgi:hypothetical protein
VCLHRISDCRSDFQVDFPRYNSPTRLQ